MSLLLTCPEPACHRAWLRTSEPAAVLDLVVQHLRRWHRLTEQQAVERLQAVTA